MENKPCPVCEVVAKYINTDNEYYKLYTDLIKKYMDLGTSFVELQFVLSCYDQYGSADNFPPEITEAVNKMRGITNENSTNKK